MVDMGLKKFWNNKLGLDADEKASDVFVQDISHPPEISVLRSLEGDLHDDRERPLHQDGSGDDGSEKDTEI